MLASQKSLLIRSCPILLGTLITSVLAAPLFGQPPFAKEVVGDFFSTNTFAFDHPWVDGVAEFPVQGRAKVSENNQTLPQDRFFFYHFNNALQDSIRGSGDAVYDRIGRSVDRYTLGVEKTFLGGQMSVELRMPTFGSSNALDGGLDHRSGGNTVPGGRRVGRGAGFRHV